VGWGYLGDEEQTARKKGATSPARFAKETCGRVPLDKSEGAVKDKNILCTAEHRLLCQRG